MINSLPSEDLICRFTLPLAYYNLIIAVKERPDYFWSVNDNNPDKVIINCADTRRDLYTESISESKKIHTRKELIFKNQNQTLVLKEFRNTMQADNLIYVAILLDNLRYIMND